MRARVRPRLLAAGVGAAAALVAGLAAGVHGGEARRAAPTGGSRSVEATFARRSYRPGASAELVVWSSVREVRIQLFRAGMERPGERARRDGEMRGAPVTEPRRFTWSGPRSRARLRMELGIWPSGLYFARLASGGRVGYAPFVLRPESLGENRVAVVYPTYTWQAYNFRDADRNGAGDTWYADPRVTTVRLDRPFLNRGVPPHYRGYDAAFTRWLASNDVAADVLADEDLERVGSGDLLARLYDLVVFPGHEEYVTDHVFDVVERYRDLGGNLAFLSANNFFYRVERRGETIVGRKRWRDVGRPEAQLLGVQYLDWNQERYANRPYVVVGRRRLPWLFAGTGLRDGQRFGNYGIEIDARTRSSPPGVVVAARVPDVFGRGRTAEMSYYETPRGAKVFAAGTLNFGGSMWFPAPRRMVENLWARLSVP